MMKVKDLHAMSVVELQKQLRTSRDELFNLRFQMATGQLQNNRQIRNVRRTLAQVLTEIRSKELAELEGEFEAAPVPAEAVADPVSGPEDVSEAEPAARRRRPGGRSRKTEEAE
jgi:large subunit ribosomal protein L29